MNTYHHIFHHIALELEVRTLLTVEEYNTTNRDHRCLLRLEYPDESNWGIRVQRLLLINIGKLQCL